MKLTEGDLLRKFNIASRYSEHIPNTLERPFLGSMITSILETSDHIYFGEPHVNGNLLKTYEMLAQNPDMFEAAAQKGVRHFALEFPENLQVHLDAYAAKEITREQFRVRVFDNKYGRFATPWLGGDAAKQFESNLIQAVDNAHNAGMAVHFADVSWQVAMLPPPQEIRELQMKLLKQHRAEKSKLSGEEYTKQHIAGLPEAERDHFNKLLADHQQAFLKERLDDTDLWLHLRGKVQRGERIMGVAGLGHLDNSVGTGMGINNQLKSDGESVTVVEIYDSRQTQSFVTELQKEVRGVKNRDLPDYTIILEENAVLDKAMKTIDPAAIGKSDKKPPAPPPALAA